MSILLFSTHFLKVNQRYLLSINSVNIVHFLQPSYWGRGEFLQNKNQSILPMVHFPALTDATFRVRAISWPPWRENPHFCWRFSLSMVIFISFFPIFCLILQELWLKIIVLFLLHNYNPSQGLGRNLAVSSVAWFFGQCNLQLNWWYSRVYSWNLIWKY